MAEPHLNGGGVSNIPPNSDQLQLTPSQNDEDDILKYLLADSSSDLSSPDGSPMLVLDNDSTTSDASPWRNDDVFPTVPSGLPDIAFEFDTSPETLLYGSNFNSMDYNSFSMEIKSAPLSPPPVVPVALVASPPQPSSPTPTQSTPQPTAAQIPSIIQSKKVSRTKKRPRVSEPPPIPSPEVDVALSRDTLLQISSQGMERYVENLSSARSLSMDDQKELKRQKRLIKNRESAQLSRERKRAYIDQLEDRINQLVNENTGLKNENSALRQALSQYEDISGTVVPKVEITSSDTTAYRKPHAPVTDSPLARHATKMAGLLTSATTIGNSRQSAAAKAGVCLMVVLFTFGLFMNTTMNPVTPRGLLSTSSASLKSDMSEIVPYREINVGYKRSILEAFPEVMDEDDDFYENNNSKQLATKEEVDTLVLPVPAKKVEVHTHAVQRQIIESPIVKPAGIYKVSYSPEPAKFWVQQENENNSTYMLFLDPRPDLEANESDAGVATPPPQSTSSDLQVSTHTHVKNVIHPGNGLPPMIISLVVPNHIANGSNPLFPKEGYHTADSLMEITCQVVDISITTSEKPHTAN